MITFDAVQNYFDLLPLEIQLQIFSYLDLNTRIPSISLVSRHFWELTKHPTLWKTIRYVNQDENRFTLPGTFVKFLSRCTRLKQVWFADIQAARSKRFFGRNYSMQVPTAVHVQITDSYIHLPLLYDLFYFFPNVKYLDFDCVCCKIDFSRDVLDHETLDDTYLQSLFKSLTRVTITSFDSDFVTCIITNLSQCYQLRTLVAEIESFGYETLPLERYLTKCQSTLTNLQLTKIVLTSSSVIDLCHQCPLLKMFHFSCDSSICDETLAAMDLLNLISLKIDYITWMVEVPDEVTISRNALYRFFSDTQKRSDLLKLELTRFEYFDDLILKTALHHCVDLLRLTLSNMPRITPAGVVDITNEPTKKLSYRTNVRLLNCHQLPSDIVYASFWK